MKLLLFSLFALLLAASLADAEPAVPAVDQPNQDFKIEPSFVDLLEMTLAGVAVYAGPGSPRIPELWNGPFQDATREGKGQTAADLGLDKSKYAYGLELYPSTFMEKHQFTYLAGFAVSDARKVPLHLLQRTIPAAHYAVFRVPGGLKGLRATFEFIYQKYFAASPYAIAFPFDMERYHVGPGGNKDGELSIEVLVPVVLKK